MIVAFIFVGMVFGAIASVSTLLSGGSFLMALAIYSGIGTGIALAAIALALIVSGLRGSQGDWSEIDAEHHSVSV